MASSARRSRHRADKTMPANAGCKLLTGYLRPSASRLVRLRPFLVILNEVKDLRFRNEEILRFTQNDGKNRIGGWSTDGEYIPIPAGISRLRELNAVIDRPAVSVGFGVVD